jgi:hypothetical protein
MSEKEISEEELVRELEEFIQTNKLCSISY